MLRLKYYNTFSMSETELAKVVDDVPDISRKGRKFDNINTAGINHFKYDDKQNCYIFEFRNAEGVYRVEIYPQWEMFLCTFPDTSFVWCAFTAINKNALYFTSFDTTNTFLPWLLNIVLNYDVYEIPAITYGNESNNPPIDID